jgi:hypothetical protein
MTHPRRSRVPFHHGACHWTWRWRLAAPPRMRRRSGEKLSLFQHDLPLPSEAAEDGLGPIPEVPARAEFWAATGTEGAEPGA